MSLSPMQARFVEQYLIDLNATHAAIRAGYAKKNAKQQGYALLQKRAVQEAVTEAIQARSERTKADQDWIVERLIENVERSMTIEPVMVGGVETGEYVYQGNVANKALELLGRHAGMFNDKLKLGADTSLLDLMRRIDGKTHGL